MTTITTPGIYDMPADVYHADPVPGGSLSSSGARKLLATCPAKFRHEQQYPTASTKAMDLGTAAHKLVLGEGPELVKVEARDWRTKAAKETRAEAQARGAVALLEDDYATVHAMAAALRAHPFAGRLFTPGRGRAEQALFWIDDEHKVWRRALIDWLPNDLSLAGRLIVPDYKTTTSARPADLPKAMATYGYHAQGAWYLDAVRALGLADDAVFLLVFQEKEDPYLVTVAQVDAYSLEIGRERNRRALEIYRDCTEAGVWPGYSSEVELISLPGWAERQHYQELS